MSPLTALIRALRRRPAGSAGCIWCGQPAPESVPAGNGSGVAHAPGYGCQARP